MGRKRADMIDGETDQLTVRLPKARLRLAGYALPDIVSWLCMMQCRYERQYRALRDAQSHGADTDAGAVYALHAHLCIGELLSRVRDSWSLRDWHEAQCAVESIQTQRDCTDSTPDPELPGTTE